MASSSTYALFHCHYAFQKFPFFCVTLCVFLWIIFFLGFLQFFGGFSKVPVFSSPFIYARRPRTYVYSSVFSTSVSFPNQPLFKSLLSPPFNLHKPVTTITNFPSFLPSCFVDTILPAALMSLGSTQPLKEMSTRNIWWGKGSRCLGLTILLPSCADCLKIWEPQPHGTFKACPGL